MTPYPSLEDVLDLHRRIIADTQGSEGVRDMAMLDAAVHRAHTGYYEGVFEQAAALLQSIVMSHPFVDGNKRTGVYAAAMMLYSENYDLVYEVDEAVSFVIDSVIQSHMDVPAIATWLEAHAQPIHETGV